MKKLALLLILCALPACQGSFAHKGVRIEGNPTVGAGAKLDRNGLSLNGVVSYESTTAPIEIARARIAEAKAREAEALLQLAQIQAANGG